MAYTLLWTRLLELDRDTFHLFVEDVRAIVARAQDMGVRISGPTGKGYPELGPETIAFNGSATCGHRHRDLGKPWASPTAAGIEEVEPPYDSKAEPWMSGPYLETRVCGGSCAGDPFIVDRRYMVRDWERPESPKRYACNCETHFKPYDLIVAAALVRFKEHFGEAVTIDHRNPDNAFEDAKRFCRELFGWAAHFNIEKPEAEILR
jgi:hypothetical protein